MTAHLRPPEPSGEDWQPTRTSRAAEVEKLEREVVERMRHDGHELDESLYPDPVRLSEADPPRPVEWAIHGLWTAGDIGMLVGDGGAFKSSATLHIAGAVAGGYPVFGKFKTKRGPALIVSAEDPENVILMRVEAFIRGERWDRERVLSNMHLYSGDAVAFSDETWRDNLLGVVAQLEPAIIVLDPLAELLDGDENSNSDARAVVKFVRKLGAVCGSAVAIVHHAGKQTKDGRTLDRIRGASAVPSASRVIYFFEWTEDGIKVENLKLSRAAKRKPFTLVRTIEAPASPDGEESPMWLTATLTYVDGRAAALTRGEEFVLAQLRMAHPRALTSTAFRAFAEGGSGVRNEDIARALNTLPARGLIEWQKGEKPNQRDWRLVDRTPRESVDGADDGKWAGSRNGSELEPAPRPQLAKLADFEPAQPAPGPSGQTEGAEAKIRSLPPKGAGRLRIVPPATARPADDEAPPAPGPDGDRDELVDELVEWPDVEADDERRGIEGEPGIA